MAKLSIQRMEQGVSAPSSSMRVIVILRTNIEIL
jgi:hypothetical protein